MPPIVSEELPAQAEPIAIPETPVELVPQTPIEVVCPNPPEKMDTEAKDQMHVLIVDDNDINVQVSKNSSYPTAPKSTPKVPICSIIYLN